MSRSDARDIVVTGIGVVTSVGLGAPQALTSVNAGICRFRDLAEFEPEVRDEGQYFPSAAVGAPADGVTAGLAGVERLLALGRPALQEALADAALDENDLRGTDLLLAGAERFAAPAGSREATILPARLLAPFAAHVESTATRFFPSGSAGALLALQAAVQGLQRGDYRRCVVGGVDSWLDPETLVALDGARRLKTEEIRDGFVPGEAAAFLVVERSADAARRGGTPYARCNDVHVAVEEHTIEKESVCTAEGLTRCLRSTVEDLWRRGQSPRIVLSDLNGESYRATEWAYALSRVFQGEGASAPATMVHPADCLGDVGAASGSLLLALAARGIRRRPADWAPALVWCSSDKGDRAACSLEAV